MVSKWNQRLQKEADYLERSLYSARKPQEQGRVCIICHCTLSMSLVSRLSPLPH